MWEQYRAQMEQIKTPEALKQQTIAQMNAFQAVATPASTTTPTPPAAPAPLLGGLLVPALIVLACLAILAVTVLGANALFNNDDTIPVYNGCEYNCEEEYDEQPEPDDEVCDEEATDTICIPDGSRNILIIPPE